MKKIVVLLCLGLLLGESAWAGNVDTYGIGSKATALGGAFAAYADDPFAVYYNPAGLTQIDRCTVSAGVIMLDPNLKAKKFQVQNSPFGNLGPTDFSDSSSNLYVPHVGFAMPLSDKLSVGLAAYVPFGLHLEWHRNGAANLDEYPGAYNAYESWYGRGVVTPTLAYKINDKWSVGLGLSLGRSEAGQYYQVRELSVLMNAPVNVEGELTDDFNYSVNVGVMYKPIDSVTLGLTYRSRAYTSFQGDFKLKGPGIKNISALFGSQKTSYDISMDDVDHPDEIQFGIRYQPHPRLSLEADLVWTNWSIVNNQTVKFKEKYANDMIGLALQQRYPNGIIHRFRDWNDTYQVRVGVEWKVTKILTLRGGYFYDPSPIPDDTFDIPWPDSDKKTYSIGFGFNLNHWVVDGVVQYTTAEAERQIGGESKNLNESYGNGSIVSTAAKGDIWGFGLTIKYIF